MSNAQIEARALHLNTALEIAGIDLSNPIAHSVLTDIKQFWARYPVLVFRDQSLSEKQQLAFTRNFGELDVTLEDDKVSSANPEILRIANVDEQGQKLAADHHIQRYFSTLAAIWHTDGSYRAVPSYASMLHALEVPPTAGETCFANAIAAYEALPTDMKRRLEGKHMVHSYEFTRRLADGLPPLSQKTIEGAPPVTHPVVRTHADGRKSLYISGNVDYYVGGMPLDEGKALHRYLLDWVTQPQFVYRHAWKVGDVVMWDNRPTLHRAMPYDPQHRRVLQRTELKGTEIPRS